MFGYIYITTNKINGKKYVGKKKGTFNNKYYGSGIVLSMAIEKYGKENFQIEILEICENLKVLNEREIFHISSIQPEYNIAKGGDGGDTLFNADEKHKKEIQDRKKQTLSNTWKSLSEEKRKIWGEAISQSKKGKSYNRPNYKHSDETKIKISESNKGWHDESWKINHKKAMEKRKGIPNKTCWKKVEVDGVVYNSVKEACEHLEISFPTLRKRIKKGKAKYA